MLVKGLDWKICGFKYICTSESEKHYSKISYWAGPYNSIWKIIHVNAKWQILRWSRGMILLQFRKRAGSSIIATTQIHAMGSSTTEMARSDTACD